MELRPFNVNVMLLCTGLVRSKIADNFAPNLVDILTSSPYAPYADLVANRLHASQNVCMATTTFARGVVKQALKTNPPSFFSYGSNTATAAIMRWLPRGLVLNLSWNVFAKHATLFGRIINFIP
jgi:short-subunit dehydrogenase